MHLSDEEFREEFKPLVIPAHFEEAETLEQKITFALAQLGEAGAAAVYAELQKYQLAETETEVKAVLSYLYEKGRIKGSEVESTMHYNLSKITEANDGAVDPDLLPPGLD
jgi:predicted transcriptional regulator